METISADKRSKVVRLTADELRILNNALNEVCNGFVFPDFEPRMGTDRETACDLLRQINELISAAECEDVEGCRDK